jgi:hypothetical protein
MPVDFETKFRESKLDTDDCRPLRSLILENHENFEKLISLIYIFGYSCPEDKEVLHLCDRYMNHPIPGLTAVCMRVAIDYWGHWMDYIHVINNFLDTSIFDVWYDEVLFSASFVKNHDELALPFEIKRKLAALMSDPRAKRLGIV